MAKNIYQSLLGGFKRIVDQISYAAAAAWERFKTDWLPSPPTAPAPPGDSDYSFAAQSYPGSRRRHYSVHAPPGRLRGNKAPLVMVLHGCRQTQRDIEYISGFNELADRHGFFVVYPFVTSYVGLRNRNCWGWWFEREIHRGAGEVEDLWQIIQEVGKNYPVDRQRIHVTGLSSGAAMSVAMLVAHGDRIASGAAVAGLPYGEQASAVRTGFNFHPRQSPLETIVAAMRNEMADNSRLPPIQIIHSRDDQTVDIQSALNIRDSWAAVLDIETRTSLELGSGTQGGSDWHHARYPAAGRSRIETVLLDGPGHGWYGGEPGEFSYPDAPHVSKMMWDFFTDHSLRG